jgi:hypothetical protein
MSAVQVGPSIRVQRHPRQDTKKDGSRCLLYYYYNYVAVFQCSCGVYFVRKLSAKAAKLNDKSVEYKGCDICTGNACYNRPMIRTSWQTCLRERIVRMQNRFRDRCGSGKCSRCEKKKRHHRPLREGVFSFCRECKAALALSESGPVIMCSEVFHLFPSSTVPWKDEPSPLFENVVRALEERQ